jgi:hypothetical protein
VLLLQTMRQLEAKSSAKSFKGTKRSLRDLQKDVQGLVDQYSGRKGQSSATVTS